jgi:hypothetical protein
MTEHTAAPTRPSLPPELRDVTRFEVINHRAPGTPGPRGRVYVEYDCSVELSLQDAGRTLKVFITDAARATTPNGVALAVAPTGGSSDAER